MIWTLDVYSENTTSCQLSCNFIYYGTVILGDWDMVWPKAIKIDL